MTFLGTASGTPTRTRNVAALALAFDSGAIWLMDCGEATQHQFMRAGLRASRVERILITHLHGDHCYGLPGMLSCMAIQGRQHPVEVVGPLGIGELLETVLRLSSAILPFPLVITELTSGRTLDSGSTSDWGVEAIPIEHRLPCFGFVLREPAQPGRFHPERARALGVPEGRLFGTLQQGQTVVLNDGRVIAPAQVSDPPRPGRHVVVLGDTCDAAATTDAAQGCDLLVREVTYDTSRRSKAAQWGHSTSEMSGRFAAEVAAKVLIITHFSARYTDDSAASGNASVQHLIEETAHFCPGTTVLAAEDLWSYAVPARE